MANFKAVILAAGKGTRMKSELPKVLHTVKGKPMVCYVIEEARKAGCDEICLIVGYKGEEVKTVVSERGMDFITTVTQEEQLGTGHAVKCAADFIGNEGDTLVLCGDTPLIKADTLAKLYKTHKENGNGVTVLSAIYEDPFGYGRIIRDSEGHFMRITEQKDCTEEEKKVQEINSGMYIFDSAALSRSLKELKNDNSQGEYYLTDTLEIIKNYGMKIEAMPAGDKNEIMGVNTLEQLAEAEKYIIG